MLTLQKLKSLGLILGFISIFFVSSITTAQNLPGNIDSNFVNPNIVSTIGMRTVSALAQQADGKIVIGGLFSSVSSAPRISLARLNANGSHDTSFNSPLTANTTSSQVNALTIQDDGKILVGGILETIAGITNLIRVNTDGSIDATFSPTPADGAGEIVIQPDGKILVGTNQRVRRLNSDGSLDLQFTNGLPFVRGLAIQSDGRIIVVSSDGIFNSVMRFNLNDTIDNSFHGGVPVLANNIINDAVIQSDDSIVVSGEFTTIDGLPRQLIARLSSNGSVDNSFNAGNLLGSIVKVKLQTDGKIIAAGRFFQSPTIPNQLGFARFNVDGAIDPTFDVLTSDKNVNESVFSIIIQPDGKIILGGRFTSIGNFTNLAASTGIGRVFGSAPTTTSVTVSGRVFSNIGRGVFNARVIVTMPNGETRTSLTNPFGYYRFDEIPIGEMYFFEIRHKYYQFVPQALVIMEETNNLNFISEP